MYSTFEKAMEKCNVVHGFRQERVGEQESGSIIPGRFKEVVTNISKEKNRRPRVVEDSI